VASGGPVPKKGMVSAQPTGGTFFMYGDDEPPAKAAVRKRPTRPAKARSAAVDRPAAPDKSAPAGRSSAGNTGTTGSTPDEEDEKN
jgi:hypothetical protein